MAEVKLEKMPLFPLNTVLFPGMFLPLHIFEPRYRLMIQRCLSLNQPFGVVLIREGVEVGGPAVPHEVGTSAYITRADRLPDGRMDVQTVGYERFKIRDLTQTEPFLVGIVESFPMEGADDPAAQALADQLRPGLRLYLKTLAGATQINLRPDVLPQDGLGLAYFAAIMLPLPLKDKQAILTTSDLASVLKAEREFLRREMMLLDYMIRSQEELTENPLTPFSPN